MFNPIIDLFTARQVSVANDFAWAGVYYLLFLGMCVTWKLNEDSYD